METVFEVLMFVLVTTKYDYLKYTLIGGTVNQRRAGRLLKIVTPL